MASTSLCTSCLRALRHQARKELNFNTTSRQTSIRAFSSTIKSAEEQRSAKPPPPRPQAPPDPSALDLSNFASSLRQTSTLRSTTEPYIAYGSTEDLFRHCTAQCSYTIPSVRASPPQPAPKNDAQEDVGVGEGWWVTPKDKGGLGLDVTFNTWAQVVMLHMWLVTVRLRSFPKEHAAIWHQNLLDHFFYAAEDRMAVWHGMTARGVRNKYLKDLWLQWRGALLSYDEGLIKGDAVLAGAVWRDVFKGKEDVDFADVAQVVAYMHRQLHRLDQMSDEKVAAGEVEFESPETVKSLVAKDSPSMRKRFTVEEEKRFGSAQP